VAGFTTNLFVGKDSSLFSPSKVADLKLAASMGADPRRTLFATITSAKDIVCAVSASSFASCLSQAGLGSFPERLTSFATPINEATLMKLAKKKQDAPLKLPISWEIAGDWNVDPTMIERGGAGKGGGGGKKSEEKSSGGGNQQSNAFPSSRRPTAPGDTIHSRIPEAVFPFLGLARKSVEGSGDGDTPPADGSGKKNCSHTTTATTPLGSVPPISACAWLFMRDSKFQSLSIPRGLLDGDAGGGQPLVGSIAADASGKAVGAISSAHAREMTLNDSLLKLGGLKTPFTRSWALTTATSGKRVFIPHAALPTAGRSVDGGVSELDTAMKRLSLLGGSDDEEEEEEEEEEEGGGQKRRSFEKIKAIVSRNSYLAILTGSGFKGASMPKGACGDRKKDEGRPLYSDAYYDDDYDDDYYDDLEEEEEEVRMLAPPPHCLFSVAPSYSLNESISSTGRKMVRDFDCVCVCMCVCVCVCVCLFCISPAMKKRASTRLIAFKFAATTIYGL